MIRNVSVVVICFTANDVSKKKLLNSKDDEQLLSMTENLVVRWEASC